MPAPKKQQRLLLQANQTAQESLPDFRAADAMSEQEAAECIMPNERARGKQAFSLMRPQDLALRLLPATLARQ
jgi:hypothetical protein